MPRERRKLRNQFEIWESFLRMLSTNTETPMKKRCAYLPPSIIPKYLESFWKADAQVLHSPFFPFSQLVKQLHKVNEALKRFSHVNKKAFEQYSNFTKQRDQLLQRKGELDESATVCDLLELDPCLNTFS